MAQIAANLTSLNLLLKATARSTVEKCLTVAFVSRTEGADGDVCAALRGLLSLEEESEEEVHNLLLALRECVGVSISGGELEALAALFEEKGQEVNPKLRSLIGQIVTARLPAWREAAVRI